MAEAERRSHRGAAIRDTPPSDVPRRHEPARAFVACLAGLLTGRRVAFVGDSSGGVPRELARLSGRRTHAYDPDTARVAAALASRSGVVASSAGEVSYAPLDDAYDVQRGAFDAIVIADLEGLVDLDVALARLRELLSARGFVAVVSPNIEVEPAVERRHEPLGYYALYDRLSELFAVVQMLGQAPFAGYTVAAFAAGRDPAVTIDTSLVEHAEEPRLFVAIASDHAAELDPYTLVQVPSVEAATWGDREPSTTLAPALAEAQLASSLKDAELDRLREREREAARLASEREGHAKRLAARVAELERELNKSREELARRNAVPAVDASSRDALDRELAGARGRNEELLRQLEEARRRSSQLGPELDRAREALAAVRRELDETKKRAQRDSEAATEAYQAELDAMLERIAELEDDEPVTAPAGTSRADTGSSRVSGSADAGAPDARQRGYEFQIEELRKALAQARGERDELVPRAKRGDEAESELLALRERLAKGPEAHDFDEVERGHAAEIDELERRLRERGELVESLRSELREAERVGRELVGQLAQASAARPQPVRDDGHEIGAELELAARKCARCEADLQAAQWRIAAMAAELDQRAESGQDQRHLEDALRHAHEQIAVLRARLERAGQGA
jgi:hypothetical protein